MQEYYKIKKINHEECLFIYLNINYEFANDLTETKLKDKAFNYIEQNKIKFNGQKVVFVINGISTKVIDINKIPTYKNNAILIVDKNKLNLKEVLLGLLFSNLSLSLNDEVLKSLVVLYRSEVIYNLNNNILDTKLLKLNYKDYNYYKLIYKETYQIYYDKFNKIINDTNGEYLIYNNKPIRCYTHLVSNGYTENDTNIPYLTKKESFWDITYKDYLQQKNYSIETIKEIFEINDEKLDIKITNISNSNRIKELQINEKKINALYLRILLDLPSTDMSIIFFKNHLTFVTRGIGNGLGLSIWGAKSLSELGLNYKQILNYYFNKVKLVIPQKS